MLGRESMLALESGQPFLPASAAFFLERLGGWSTTLFASVSSSSQGAGEWKRILGPYMLILGSSSSSSGESSSLSWRLLSSAEERGSSSRSRLLALGMARRSLSEMGERGESEMEGLYTFGLGGKRKEWAWPSRMERSGGRGVKWAWLYTEGESENSEREG